MARNGATLPSLALNKVCSSSLRSSKFSSFSSSSNLILTSLYSAVTQGALLGVKVISPRGTSLSPVSCFLSFLCLQRASLLCLLKLDDRYVTRRPHPSATMVSSSCIGTRAEQASLTNVWFPEHKLDSYVSVRLAFCWLTSLRRLMDRWEEQPLPTATFMFIKSAVRTIPEEDFASHWSQVWLVLWVALCDWPSKNSVFHFLGREGGVCV